MTLAAQLAGPAPGMFPGVSFPRYLDIPATNFSKLKEIGRSPLLYRHRLEHPKESDAMTLGRAAHTATLEPDTFEQRYALWDERTEAGNVRPRKGKDYEFFESLHPGKEILLASEWNPARAVGNAFRSDPRALRYIASGEPEVSLIWTDADSGRVLKGRVDWLTKLDGVETLVGLKTSRDIRMRPFASACAAFGYHLQWAMYADGFESLTGIVPRVVEIVVEKLPPYDIAVFQIPDDVLELGRARYKEYLERLGQCEKANDWPGAMPGEQMLQLPDWMYEGDDDLGELGLEEGGDDE